MNDQKLLTFTPNKENRKMNTTKECKMMRDAKGDLVPVKYVSAFDKLRDRNVNKIVNNGRKLRTALEKFMIESIALMNEVAAQKESHGDKGNLSVSSFDGLLRVSIRQRYNIFFDARVREARDKMFAYVDSVLSRVKAEDAQALRVILQEAFRVGANNMLSTSKVMALIRMDIKNADWKAAQEVLKAALTPQKGKQYLMLETRPDSNHDFQSIRLDVADCWPVEAAASVPEVV